MRYKGRLCSLCQRGWTALCRVAVRNSSRFPLYSYPCGFWPWHREATGGICLFRQICRWPADKTCPNNRIYWQSLWKELLEKSKYCLILHRFHVFFQYRYLSVYWTSSALPELWMGGGLWPDKNQTSHLVQIYQYPFLLSSGNSISPPVGLLCLPANVLVTCCCVLVSSDTSVKCLRRGKHTPGE